MTVVHPATVGSNAPGVEGGGANGRYIESITISTCIGSGEDTTLSVTSNV